MNSNLAEKLQSTTISIADVRRDGGTQMRENISDVTVITYAEHMIDGAEFPAVTVFYDGSEYWLADGFHRCAAFEKAGFKEMPADIRSGTQKDAVRFALRANATNGKPRTNGDFLRAYRVAVDAGLCKPEDTETVKELLLCGLSRAKELTSEAKAAIKRERDAEIIRLKEEGKTQNQIAKSLGVSQPLVAKVSNYHKSQSGFCDNDEEDETVDIFSIEEKESVKQANAIKRKEKEARKQHKDNIKSIDVPDENIHDPEFETLNVGWHRVGRHYLYCGSNLDKEFRDFLPPAQLAFADPPYNAGVDDWDHNFVWQQDFIEDIADYVAVTPGGWNAMGFYKETNMTYQWEVACWIKNGMTHGRCGYSNWIKASIFGKKPKLKQDFFDITIKVSETEETSHKGRKPYQFMSMLIDMLTGEGDTVIDVFGGSGTTLLISEQIGRTAYLAELSPEYCALIVNRAKKLGCDYEQL